jgi:hypothetical protein
MKTKIGRYQERKKAGLCVWTGCERKPRKNDDGTVRSYCDFHNELNKKATAAFKKRAAAEKKGTHSTR